jgi:hypothetical protein
MLQEVLRIPVEYQIERHIIEEDVERYAARRIPPGSELDRLQQHLRCCEQCFEAAKQAENLLSALRIALRVQRHVDN